MSDNALQLNAIQPLAGHTARTSGIWRRCLLTIKLGLAGFTGEFANPGKNPTTRDHRDIVTAQLSEEPGNVLWCFGNNATICDFFSSKHLRIGNLLPHRLSTGNIVFSG